MSRRSKYIERDPLGAVATWIVLLAALSAMISAVILAVTS